MIHATNIAVVSEDNIVTNVIWGIVYGEDGNQRFIQADDLPITIGDTYEPETNKFYHDGELVKTWEEERHEMQTELDALKDNGEDMTEALSLLGVTLNGEE